MDSVDPFSLLQASTDCIKVLDVDARLLFMSAGGKQRLEIDDFSRVANAEWLDFWTGKDKDAARTAIDAARAGGIGHFQGYCPTWKGTPNWWDVLITPILGVERKPERLLAISRDVTEERNAQDQLRSTLESIGDGFIACDADWRLVYVNELAERISGMGRAELLKRSFWDALPFAAGTNMEREFRDAAAGETKGFDAFHAFSNRWFRYKCFPRAGGGISVYFQDITDRKRTRDSLREALRQIQPIADNMPAAVARCSRDLRYVWVNPGYARLLKRSGPEEFVGQPISQVLGQEGLTALQPHIDKVLAGERDEFETLASFPGTETRWLHAVFAPTVGLNQEVDGWIAVIADVTERRETVERLRTSEGRLKDAQRLAKVGNWTRQIDVGASYWSDEMYRIFGLPNDGRSGLAAFIDCVHPEDRKTILEIEQELVLGGAPIEVEYRIIRPNGDIRVLRSVAEGIKDDKGTVSRTAGATQDITEQVRARERLQESEGRLRSAERLSNVGHWHWDLSSNQVSWSEECFRIFGQTPDYIPSFEGLLRQVIPQDRERVDREVRRSLAEKSRFDFDFQMTRPDGELRTIRSISELAFDDNGLPVRIFGTAQDVTDSRRAQEESVARQKLESLGTLASGIAHDFNNLLGSVMVQAELGLSESAVGTFPEPELKTIRNIAIRGSEIVRQLMIYAGKDRDFPEPVDVSQVVGEMLELFGVSVSKRARLETNLGQGLPAVWASAAHIRQIVLNLAINASDAIGERAGVITVTTSCVKAGHGSANFGDGNCIRLEVSDTGRGMSPEVQARVFDPFFTTKSTGHGMGLAVVNGIVRGLRGSIDVTSEPDKGTQFEVWLPCADSTSARTDQQVLSIEKSPASSSIPAVVLVAENEDALREPVVKMLRNSGFEVLEASGGRSAMDLINKNGNKIDILFLDMMIPCVSCNEVVAEALKSRPDVCVVLTSPYSQETVTSVMGQTQVHAFIRKPFQLETLVKVLQDVVSSTSGIASRAKAG
jgi:PAS domain S-box-containing protein